MDKSSKRKELFKRTGNISLNELGEFINTRTISKKMTKEERFKILKAKFNYLSPWELAEYIELQAELKKSKDMMYTVDTKEKTITIIDPQRATIAEMMDMLKGLEKIYPDYILIGYVPSYPVWMEPNTSTYPTPDKIEFTTTSTEDVKN